MGNAAFYGVPDTTVRVAATTSHQPTALKGLTNNLRPFQIRVVVLAGGANVWFRTGDNIATVSATVNASRLIPAGNTETFTVSSFTNCFDVITESGTSTIYVETGEGL